MAPPAKSRPAAKAPARKPPTGSAPPAPKTAADIAAERRAAKNRTGPPAPVPGAVPASIVPAGPPPETVIASRTLVSAHQGAHGPATPAGGVFMAKPLVLQPLPATALDLPEDAEYAIAACDADEAMIPPGASTPVVRSLWFKGWRVRRDFYDAVLAAHAAKVAAGTATQAEPAELPPGVDAIPTVALINPPDPQPAAGPTPTPADVAQVTAPAVAPVHTPVTPTETITVTESQVPGPGAPTTG